VRRGAQSVTCGWPEVERGGVCHDLDGIPRDFPGESGDVVVRKMEGPQLAYSVIPDRDVVRLPLEPDLKVVVLADLSE